VVFAVLTFEKTGRDEGIEEVARGARVEAEAAAQCLAIRGVTRQFGEDLHLDGAQERFRCPEGEAGLQDVIRGGV
jgi:hypothetical protein